MRRLVHIFATLAISTFARAGVEVQRLPEGALQPQTLVDGTGTTHLIYLSGRPELCDVLYSRLKKGDTNWSRPMRVNSQPGSAIAIGTIRGAQLALGRNGRVNVCWNGSDAALPKINGKESPLLYSRLNDLGDSFEPQRNLMTATRGLDGGCSLTADADGRIFVVWHGLAIGGPEGETNRAVFLSESNDDGKTFARERVISPGTGACGCCGLKAFADGGDGVFVLYRAAQTVAQRDMTLIGSRNHGKDFSKIFTHPWPVGACPMSSAFLTGGPNKVWAAWETQGRIYLTGIADAATKDPTPRFVGSQSGAKHPCVVLNARGETLVVWTEGTGWQRGGTVAWQVLAGGGEPSGAQGRGEGLAVWSYATAFARPNGDFVVLF